ncbi:hypothetical protein NKH72_22300 [Mesorhizobium sp. M0955]|uniref:hypothetical protein n=1 Tax=Mesorhizobium sp. M0955 TaxID=2957033 RepID=UPI00333C5EE7
MPSDTANVKLGVCTVLFDGIDLGFTKGGVEVEVQTNTHVVNVDQFGETPVDEVIMGRTVQVTAPLAETTLQNLVRTMPGATLVATGAAYASGTVTFATTAPVNNDQVVVDGVVFAFKTAPALPNEMAIPATIAAAAIALAAAINADTTTYTKVAASANAGVVTLTARDYGTVANAYTLAKTGTNITVSGATLAGGTIPPKSKVSVKTGVSQSLLATAKKLVLRPVGTSGADDFTVFKANTPGNLSYAYNLDNERIFKTVFKGYADAAGNLFSVGNDSAT